MWNKLSQRHWQTSQSSPDEARKPMALAQRALMLYTNTVWHSNCGIFKPRKNDPRFNKQPLLFFEWMWKVCFFCLLSWVDPACALLDLRVLWPSAPSFLFLSFLLASQHSFLCLPRFFSLCFKAITCHLLILCTWKQYLTEPPLSLVWLYPHV